MNLPGQTVLIQLEHYFCTGNDRKQARMTVGVDVPIFVTIQVNLAYYVRRKNEIGVPNEPDA